MIGSSVVVDDDNESSSSLSLIFVFSLLVVVVVVVVVVVATDVDSPAVLSSFSFFFSSFSTVGIGFVRIFSWKSIAFFVNTFNSNNGSNGNFSVSELVLNHR